MNDEELVQRHLLGDENAFPELVQRHIRSIYNLAYRSTGDGMEAENIAQETFARAYAALPRWQPGTPFKPWLLTIALNLCRNWARRAGREQPIAQAHPASEDEAEDDPLDRLADPGPDPLEMLVAAETSEALERAVQALPLPYRQAIILRYVEGLSYEELAQTLGLPLNTVRTHLLRAKERLRRALTEGMGREADGLSRDSAAPGPLWRGVAECRREAASMRASGRLRRVPQRGA
jgi:RNA polymerase sigma-70 factor (ECF subfamily)